MKLETNRAWNQAIALLGANKDVVVVVAGVFFFLPYLAFLMVMPDLGTNMADPEAANAAFEQLGAFYARFWWAMVLVMLAQGIGMLGLLALLTDHRRPTVGDALKIGASKVLSYIAAYLIVGMVLGLVAIVVIGGAAASGSVAASIVGFLAVFIGMLYLFVKFSLVPPVLVKEGLANPITALGRSWRLTKGNSVRLFVFYFLLFLAMMVVMMVISIVVSLIFALFGPQAALFGNALVAALVNAVWVSGFLAVLASVHEQLGGTSSVEISETFE
jgi:hypothetical protein